MQIKGIDSSTSTVRCSATLRRPYRGAILTDRHRQHRRVWTQQHQQWGVNEWNGVLFSDECRVCVDRPDRRRCVWRRKGERYSNACIMEGNRWGGASVMLWAAISTRHRTPLIVVNGNLTAQRYVDQILRPVLLQFLQMHPDLPTFQQDNARPHSARLTQEFLAENNVNVMHWPANSPDLSPIEHLWDQLKTALSKRQPPSHNQQQLVVAVQEEWESIPQDRIARLIIMSSYAVTL